MRRLFSLAVLAALAAATAACDISPSAATVEGASVSRSQLDAQLSAISQSPYAQCALQLQGENLPSTVAGAGDFTVSTQLSSAVLSTMVLERLVDADLARRGHPVTATDLADAKADLATQLTPGSGSASPCPGALAGQPLVDRLPPLFRNEEVGFLAAQEQLAITLGKVDVSRPALLAYYKAHPSQFQEICLSDIAVSTQAEAQSIRAAITSGSTSFAAQAAQNSIDTQTAPGGGQIPCVAASQIVNQVILNAISGLGPGQISQPVFENTSSTGASNGVWFLLKVDSRPTVAFSQAQSSIRQQLLSAQNATVSAEFSRLAKKAKVVIDPRYGTWSPTSGVVAPPAPPADDLLSRTADVPGTAAAGSVAGAPSG